MMSGERGNGRLRIAGLVAGVGALGLLLGGVATATIPTSTTGRIAACYRVSSGALRVIDVQAQQKCTAGERLLTWGPSFVWRGAYSAKAAYAAGSVVLSHGSSYVARIAVPKGKAPSGTGTQYWGLLAAAGATGPQGPQGDPRAMRSISFPAQALNINPANPVITPSYSGLVWKNSYAASANVSIRRPADWDGVSDVTVRILFTRADGGSGDVQFFLRPRDFDRGDPVQDAPSVLSTLQSPIGPSVYREVTITIGASTLQKSWWDLVIQRNDFPGGYSGDVRVYSVDVSYYGP